MSDSFGTISSPVPSHPGQNNGRGGQTVQILKLPNTLLITTKSIRIDGKISQTNQNGTASIDTPEGTIEVIIKGNRPPQVGQRLEVEIPAGRPARQAAIRNAPTVPAPPESAKIRATYDAPLQARLQASGATPPTTARTPLPPAIQEAASQINTANIGQQSRPLTQEAIVRLLAIPPAQAQNIATEFIQKLPQPQANIVNRVNFAANIAAQDSQQNINSLLQVITPSPLNTGQISGQITTPTILTGNRQTPYQPLQNVNLLQVAATQNTTSPTGSHIVTLPTITTAPTIPAAQTLPANAATAFLQSQNAQTMTPTNVQPQTASLTPVPVIFDPTATTTISPPRVGSVDIQIIKIIPPTPTLSAPTTLPQQAMPTINNVTPPLISSNNAVSLTAQVTGFTTQNLPLVSIQWPGSILPQNFILQQNTNNLQLGSQIQVIPKITPITAQALPSLSRLAVSNPLLQGFQWPALDELYNSLQQLSPQAAASLGRTLPNAGTPSQLGPAAMMFIAAIRSGDVGAWIGDKKMDLLQQSQKIDLLSRLTQKPTATMPVPAAETTPSNDWRAVPLPMFWEGEIHKITLYTRHENQSGQQENQGQGRTRFVFDLSLSRMGDIQLDGLLRDNRLDLIIRANNSFSLPMQQTMRQAYAGALDHTDLTGELNFQGDTKNWVHVLEKKENLGVDA
jgi:hypothetical protein